MTQNFTWRDQFNNSEYESLHSEAFGVSIVVSNVDQVLLHEKHSLGWVTARDDDHLVGFVNIISDGHAHAWLQDLMVANAARHRGVGTQLVAVAKEECVRAGCEWLHVDFEEGLSDFYIDTCQFTPSLAGLIRLKT